MKNIILTISLISSTIYSSVAFSDTTERSGLCNVSIVKVGRIFDISLGEFSYRITSNAPALECEKLAIKLGQEKQLDPENSSSKLSIRYSFSSSIELNP